MKSIDQIKDEIDGLVELRLGIPPENETASEKIERLSELNRARRRIKILNLCVAYLETNPTDEFIKKEIDRLNERINVIDGRFTIEYTKPFATLSAEKEAKKSFNKEYGVPKIKEQLKLLKFLLK